MSLRVIIPVKPFAEAKQRLAPALSVPQRVTLARDMFHHVFAMALDCFGARLVIVVSRSSEIISYAESQGATGLAESGTSDLNSALTEAAARARCATKVLTLASDLPLLENDDLRAMSAEDCAIAPDRHGTGTNALVWPANPTPGFHFGENSFERHRAAARVAGLAATVIRRDGLACDIDVPADLSATLARWPNANS